MAKRKQTKKSKWMTLVKKFGIQKAAKKYKPNPKKKVKKKVAKKSSKKRMVANVGAVLKRKKIGPSSSIVLKRWGREYVTWIFNHSTGDYSLGHYFKTKRDAERDFSKRVQAEAGYTANKKKTVKKKAKKSVKRPVRKIAKKKAKRAVKKKSRRNPGHGDTYSWGDRKKWLGKVKANFAKRLGKYGKEELEEVIAALATYDEQTPIILDELRILYKQYEKKHGKKATTSLVKKIAEVRKSSYASNPDLLIGNPVKMKVVKRSKNKFKTSRSAWSDIKKKTGIKSSMATAAHSKKFWQWGVPAYAANPVQGDSKKLKAAEKMYKKFHGASPREIIEIEVPDDHPLAGEYLVSMGDAVDETYKPPKHSKKSGATYLHKYEGKAHKAVLPDGSAVVTVGDFTVGSRGIEG